MKKIWLPLLALAWLCPQRARTQPLSSISARWSDSFVEWALYTAAPDTVQTEDHDSETSNEEEFGELKLRWLDLRDDWSEWDFTLGEERGTIKMKWKDDPTQWELRTYNGSVVTMRAAWSNDLSEWRVTDNTVSITLRSRWTSQYDEWLVQDPARGTFYLYTMVEGDPRDWKIEDNLDETVSQPMKLALIFLTIFHSTPHM